MLRLQHILSTTCTGAGECEGLQGDGQGDTDMCGQDLSLHQALQTGGSHSH